jgi:hypothetical protein
LPEKDETVPTELASQSGASAASCPFHRFLNLTSDPKWADIQQPNGGIRAHPVEWMTLISPPNVAMQAAGIKA